MYPKVRVKVQEDNCDDDFDVQEEKNSSIFSKGFEYLPLKAHPSPSIIGKEHKYSPSLSIAKIPKIYIPNLATPPMPSSKGEPKNDKQIEEDNRCNIRASSIPPPRAVLSSPDNDGKIGQINQLTRERRTSLLRKNSLGQNTPPQGKVNPGCVKVRNSINSRQESKEITNSKTNKVMPNPELTDSKPKTCFRKAKPSSNLNGPLTISRVSSSK